MLEKYLNKEVKILTRTLGTGLAEKEEGMITSVSENFIELDNRKLINISFIFQIILK